MMRWKEQHHANTAKSLVIEAIFVVPKFSCFPSPLFLGAAIFTFACMVLCSLRFVRINASRTHNTHMHTPVRSLFLVTFFPAL